jgi:hypothetical protein
MRFRLVTARDNQDEILVCRVEWCRSWCAWYHLSILKVMLNNQLSSRFGSVSCAKRSTYPQHGLSNRPFPITTPSPTEVKKWSQQEQTRGQKTILIRRFLVSRLISMKPAFRGISHILARSCGAPDSKHLVSSLHQQFLHPIQRILNAASTSSTQFPNLFALPADAHEIQRPLLVLLLEELYRERLGPSFDDIARLSDHLIEGLERHAVVRDALPFVIHVDM